MRRIPSGSPWIAWLLSLALAVPQGLLAAAQAQPTTAQQKPPAQGTAAQTPKTTTQAAPPASTAGGDPPPGTNADTGWPRAIELKTGTALWYQPQVESWAGQKNIVAWSAVAYQPTGAKEPALGTIKIEGPTVVSLDERVVSLDLRVTEYNFKTLAPDQVKALVADVQTRPINERVIDLDRVLASVDKSQLTARETPGIKADPPQVFSAPAPAILINLDGEPIWSPIEGIDLRYALNTNWDLFEQTATNTLYLRYNTAWLQATTVNGPWTAVAKGKLPASFSKLPADANWNAVKSAVPGTVLSSKEIPKVFVSTTPAELIVLNGPLSYLKVEGAQTLLWVNNTESDLFRMGREGDFYFLVAGRWFKSASLEGPWTFATPSLPADFKEIPVEHPRSRVLASVPGSAQAAEAVLLASIPRTARVNKKELKAPDVVYQGEPQFKPIDGSKNVQQAVNTDKDIVKYGDLYYMCFQGVWFMSRAATGPWEVANSIPQEIYSIPTSSPVHHVTYVTVEDDDDNDEWVTFAYVAAYTGMMIGFGCAMWGSGWYYPPYYYPGFRPIYYPYPHTYGMGAWYNPYSGAYGRGYAAYGPYGGVGMGASYNPRTGTYARGAAAYGPYGSRSAAQAYNPRTGAYGQTRQGSNVYGNWGTSSVQRGDQWAQTAHKQNYQTGRTTTGARTSSGAAAVRSSGPGGSTTVGRTQGGDVYAGRDGNVYRRNEGGGWDQSNGSGGWNPVDSPDRPTPTGDRAGTAGDRAATGDRAAGAGAGTTAATPRAGTTGATSQLERDSSARAQGNQRAADRSGWQSSGSSRSGAGSYGGSGGGRSYGGGGGSRGGGGGRRR